VRRSGDLATIAPGFAGNRAPPAGDVAARAVLSRAGMRLAIMLLLAVAACGGSSSGLSAGGAGDDSGSAGGEGGAAGDDAGVTGDGAGGTSEAGACATTVTPAAGVVVTDTGPVQGVTASGAWAYLGIPYAAPPVGALRWSATQPHACWSSALQASTFGAMCLQVDSNDTTKVLGQEDCLTVNVWAPSAATATSALPTVVFIHGGGNVQGSSSDTASDGSHEYDGAALAAAENAVVVTFNYRLGALGFLGHTSFGPHPGNYGTLDQVFALGWVHRNVAAFGGDPSRVLVFGQSAGAEDVCDMVASPLTAGLFSAALMESGGCTARPLATVESFAQTWATKAGCGAAPDPASCLRALDATAVTLVMPEPASIAGSSQGDYEPDVDGVALTAPSDQVLASGQFHHVPFVIGSNSDETALELAKGYPSGMTTTQYQAAVLAYAKNDQNLASQIVAEYPLANYPSPLEAYVQVTTDAKFTDGARYAARAAAEGQPDQPVWRYFYVHRLENAPAATKALGAWHGIELAFLFRDLGIASYTPSAGEMTLSTSLGGAWTSMAAGGAPDVGASVAWPKYDAATDPYTQLDDTFTTGTGVRTALCDFWDGVLGR
jgi:para-nitrobenzyl esterase